MKVEWIKIIDILEEQHLYEHVTVSLHKYSNIVTIEWDGVYKDIVYVTCSYELEGDAGEGDMV